ALGNAAAPPIRRASSVVRWALRQGIAAVSWLGRVLARKPPSRANSFPKSAPLQRRIFMWELRGFVGYLAYGLVGRRVGTGADTTGGSVSLLANDAEPISVQVIRFADLIKDAVPAGRNAAEFGVKKTKHGAVRVHCVGTVAPG